MKTNFSTMCRLKLDFENFVSLPVFWFSISFAQPQAEDNK